ISFDQDYTINLAAVTITPDPIALQDYAFVNLTSLKAAAVALKGEWKTQTTQSVVFQDAQTKLDNTEMVKQKKALWEAAEKRYEEAKLQFLAGDKAIGKGIFGPLSHPDISLYYNDSSPRFYGV